MLNHYLLTLYRSLTRHRLYAALNVLGLAVGIAVFLVLWLDVRFETGFERWIPDARSIYLVRTTWPGEAETLALSEGTSPVVYDALVGDYPGLVGTRVWDNPGTVRQGGRVTAEDHVEAVDADFFKVFDLPLVRGDKASLLRAPDDIVITQARAKRYFGDADPIGRSLTIATQGITTVYRVAGVLKDPPADTDTTFDLIVPINLAMKTSDESWRDWRSEQLYTYLRFDTPAQVQALDRDFDSFLDRHVAHELGRTPHKDQRLRTQPMLSLHLLDPKAGAVVTAMGAVGLLTLIMAAVNYINLATARAGLRAREVALRKVMGATGQTLVRQFMGEALTTAFLAALIGLSLSELALPLVNAAGGLSLRIDYLGRGSVVPPLLGAVALIGLGAGVYPALVLSGFQPAAVLAAARAPGGGRMGARIREGLVIVQFTIAIAFTIATAAIVSQSHYLRHADLGFKRTGLVVVSSFDDAEVTGAQRASLLAAWRAMPEVVGATASDMAPGNDDHDSITKVVRPGAPGHPVRVSQVMVGRDFFSTYGVRPITGRALDPAHGGDDAPPAVADPPPPTRVGPPPPIPNVVINANAARALGLNGAIGPAGEPILRGKRQVQPYSVVGVIDNLRFRSPRDPTPPTVYILSTGDFRAAVAGVRYAAADPRAVLDRLGAAWRRIAPNVPFRAATIEDNLRPYYKSDDQHGRLFTLGAILAVGIGCVGLYGLASFTTARRVKEIGIRKTLGASMAEILRLLVGQFLRPVLLANLVAWPLAWLAMRQWLSGFDQRITLSPAYFLAATFLTLVIAVGTVAGQAFAVARAEPAKALRHE